MCCSRGRSGATPVREREVHDPEDHAVTHPTSTHASGSGAGAEREGLHAYGVRI